MHILGHPNPERANSPASNCTIMLHMSRVRRPLTCTITRMSSHAPFHAPHPTYSISHTPSHTHCHMHTIARMPAHPHHRTHVGAIARTPSHAHRDMYASSCTPPQAREHTRAITHAPSHMRQHMCRACIAPPRNSAPLALTGSPCLNQAIARRQIQPKGRCSTGRPAVTSCHRARRWEAATKAGAHAVLTELRPGSHTCRCAHGGIRSTLHWRFLHAHVLY